MESAAVLKRGVGYEMSRLGHYLTQVSIRSDGTSQPDEERLVVISASFSIPRLPLLVAYPQDL